MEVFLELYKSLLPVLAFIVVGYYAKKWFDIKPTYVSKPLIFFLVPVLVLYNVTEASTSKILVIPVISFLISLAMNAPAIWAHRTIAKEENPHLIKGSFTFFNVLFFGLPVINALFGSDATSVLICVYLGTALYGDIIGYFQVAKTKLNTKDALREIIKVPYLYVFAVAIGIKIWGLEIPEEVGPLMSVTSKLVSCLGMAIVGIHLTDVNFREIKLPYFGKLLGFRTLAAIGIAAIFIGGEYLIWQSLEPEDYMMLILIPFLPVASNISLFASYLKTAEERFAIVVLLSIGLSMVLVPIVAQFFPS